MNTQHTQSKTVERKKAEDILSSGFYSISFRRFLHSVSPRVFAIISARFGAGGKKPMTLEEIGKIYGITRERIRQIIFVLLSDVRAKRFTSPLEEVQKKIEWTLKRQNGIIEKEKFFGAVAGNDASERGAVRFFLSVLSEWFILFDDENIRPSIALASFSKERWSLVNTGAKRILSEENASISETDLLKRLQKEPDLASFKKEELLDFLSVSREIIRNPFGRWGFPEWSDICPRGTRERAYLVVQSEGKPLHFREIAKMIDRCGLQKAGRLTHPQTVHNELIKDKRFVLVGRGTYALVKWGYKRGTVREVLEEILKERKSPMTRDALVAEVLKIRNVKESTIIINLNTFFSKLENDRYFLKEK